MLILLLILVRNESHPHAFSGMPILKLQAHQDWKAKTHTYCGTGLPNQHPNRKRNCALPKISLCICMVCNYKQPCLLLVDLFLYGTERGLLAHHTQYVRAHSPFPFPHCSLSHAHQFPSNFPVSHLHSGYILQLVNIPARHKVPGVTW